MKRLSIAMATRNSARYLPDALASIATSLADAAIETEIVLADGGSTDETLAIAAAQPGLRIVSRADSGIYDGMNRALAEATGDYVIILNSDDMLPATALREALSMIERSPDSAFISGQALFGSSFGDAITRSHRDPLSPEGAMFGVPAINARIFRGAALRTLGPIRTDLGLASDREWMARLAQNGARGCAFDAPLYLYRVHAGSHTISGDREGAQRVYEAERRLADKLIADASTNTALRRLASATKALAQMKLRLTGAKTIGLLEIAPTDLVRALALAHRWRGRLSGF